MTDPGQTRDDGTAIGVPNDDRRSLASVNDALDSASVRPQGSPVQARRMDCEATTSKDGRERLEVGGLVPQPVY
jgi:hypothetical protein